MLLAARHEDGEPNERRGDPRRAETLLVAGHETTATELACASSGWSATPTCSPGWCRDRRRPRRVRDGDAIRETLRRRPVLLNAAPRKVTKPIEVGGRSYEPGTHLVANAYLVPARPRDLPRALRVPARALPRIRPGHLHVDSLRRRPTTLRRRQLRDARDGDRAQGPPLRVELRSAAARSS